MPKKIIFQTLFAITAAFFILVLWSNFQILGRRGRITHFSQAPTSTLAIVFGAGVTSDGRLSPMLRDRVITGAQLYADGKVQKILMTGDDGGSRRDEINPMIRTAVSLEVPQNAVSADPHGYRTYESCYREFNVYGVTSSLVVSQSFHLPRIIYLCESFGMDVIGVAADLSYYGDDSIFMQIREIGARTKAWWQVNISKPLPRNLQK